MVEEYKVKVILTDLEGTTTSINFVKDVLFPYAKEHVRSYLEETWTSKDTLSTIAELKSLPEFKDYRSNFTECEENIEFMADFVNHLIDRDLKLGPLKTLQGHIWSKGYSDGTLKGHFYEDVPEALKQWQEDGIVIAIYSSGSVKAQQLLFHYAEAGDLSGYISQYFDTSSGHKQSPESYRVIMKNLNVENSSDILFLTDVVKEADAAQEAGLRVAILDRPGNHPLSPEERQRFLILRSFRDLKLQRN